MKILQIFKLIQKKIMIDFIEDLAKITTKSQSVPWINKFW
jgi:hypothetical protein